MKPTLWLLLLAPALAGAAPNGPGDFAFSQALQISGGAAYHELSLSAEVLAALTRKDFGDLRVFDAQGAPQPHAWRPESPAAELAPKARALPFFPLPARALHPGSALSIDVSSGETRVKIRGGAPAARAEATVGYLLDAREFSEPLAALTLDWQEPRVYQGRVRLEASEDLLSWTTLAASAPILRSEYQGRSLARQRVEWSPRAAKYLRLTWPQGESSFVLTAASAEAAAGRGETARSWLAAKFLKAGDKPGEFIYESPKALPVDRLRLVFGTGNHMLPAEFLAREREDEPWIPLAQSVFYRVSQGSDTLQSPDLVLTRSQHRYWLLRADPRLALNAAPMLEFGWLPPRLVFLAQGSAPFQLAYGARDAQSAALSMVTLVPDWERRKEEVFSVATPGERQTAGGEARLAAPTDWKRWALWGVLVAGVALLVMLAWGLMRETGKK